MTTERPSGTPPTSEPRSDSGPSVRWSEPEPVRPSSAPKSESVPPGRSSELDLVRQTLPAIAPAISQRPGTMKLASGRSLSVVELGNEERLEVHAASGELLLSVRLTDEGLVFSLAGASLDITSAKNISIGAENVRVAATKTLSLEAGELHRVKARDVEIDASPGAVSIRANDDVDINGERVRLNSDDPPMPQSWEEYRARRAAQGHPFSDDMPLSPMRPPVGPPSIEPASPSEPVESSGLDP